MKTKTLITALILGATCQFTPQHVLALNTASGVNPLTGLPSNSAQSSDSAQPSNDSAGVEGLENQIAEDQLAIAKIQFKTEITSQAGMDHSPADIIALSQKAYATIETYRDDGWTVHEGGNDAWTNRFTELLGRNNSYNVEVVTAAHPFSRTNLEWSDGKISSLQQVSPRATPEFDPALVSADSMTPSLFYDLNWGNFLNNLKFSSVADLVRQQNESVGGVECYVLHQAGLGMTVWIGRQDFLVRRFRHIIGENMANDETHNNVVINESLSKEDYLPAPVAAAEHWPLAPGEKVDPQTVLTEATDLMNRGHYEESLERHLWYHQHALEYGPGQTGVRLSFALSEWVELGHRYPPARQALIDIRDEDARKLGDGQGNASLFADVSSINRELGDENATYALYQKIATQDSNLAGQCYYWAENILAKKGQYQLCYDHMGDPQLKFDQMRKTFTVQLDIQKHMADTRARAAEQIAKFARGNGQTNLPPMPDNSYRFKQMADDHFVGQVRQLVEILVGAGHKADAEKIRDQAVAALDDPRLQSAVSDAVEKIGGQKSAAEPKNDASQTARGG